MYGLVRLVAHFVLGLLRLAADCVLGVLSLITHLVLGLLSFVTQVVLGLVELVADGHLEWKKRRKTWGLLEVLIDCLLVFGFCCS